VLAAPAEETHDHQAFMQQLKQDLFGPDCSDYESDGAAASATTATTS
jgi:hypothetical protein